MLLGHQKIWQYFTKSAELGKLSHAFLFSGPEKLGKKTFAIEFVKWLFQNPTNYEFNRITNKNIEASSHPDLIFITPIKKEIQISQIRECIWRLSLKPSIAPFKVAIIDQAHCMNQEAQNCFLKTLEEPKGNTLLILITEYPESLFPTILSRLQKIRFSPVKKTEIENYLKEKKLEESEIKEILEISEGKPGLAKDLATNPGKLKERREKIKKLAEITNSDLVSRFQYVKTISQDIGNLKETLDIWLSYFRKIFLQQYLTSDIKQVERLKNIIKIIQNTNFLISTTNVNPRLALENLMLEL